jgi:hypothetical protein
MVTEPPDVVKEKRATTRFPIGNVHDTAGGGRRRNRESIGLDEGETG